jgi:hypothetical protein
VNNPYRVLGIILTVSGAILGPYFYFVIGAVPLAAGAMSAVILGLSSYLISTARPYISPEACQVLLKTGMENTSALLEELGVRNKAVYLPSNLRNGYPQALIPLAGNGDLKKIQGKLPGRLIVRYGPKAEDMALAVTTPGSVNLKMLENKPGPHPEEIESAISYLLTGMLDVASGVSVSLSDSVINVEVSGVRMGYEDIHFYRCLGSPVASIAAAVSSEALQKPVRVMEESMQKGKGRIILEVLS